MARGRIRARFPLFRVAGPTFTYFNLEIFGPWYFSNLQTSRWRPLRRERANGRAEESVQYRKQTETESPAPERTGARREGRGCYAKGGRRRRCESDFISPCSRPPCAPYGIAKFAFLGSLARTLVRSFARRNIFRDCTRPRGKTGEGIALLWRGPARCVYPAYIPSPRFTTARSGARGRKERRKIPDSPRCTDRRPRTLPRRPPSHRLVSLSLSSC